MSLFSEVTGEVAIIIDGGVYKQVPLYIRYGRLYAQVGSGFIKLQRDGSTSKPKVRLETLTWDHQALGSDKLGWLCDPTMVEDAIPLQPPLMKKLFGLDK